MRTRAEARTHRPSFEVLERREVTSSVGTGGGLLQFLERLPTPVLQDALQLRTRVTDRGARTPRHHGATAGHHHQGDGLTGLIELKKKKKGPTSVPGPPGPQGPAGPQGPTGPQGLQGPSGTVIPFNLAAGANSALITVPADQPVFVIGTSTTSGDRGTGFISLEHAAGLFLEWSGTNSTTGGVPTLTGGFTSVPGTTMLAFDFNAKVTLQVADADHFVIHNGDAAPRVGFIWILPAPM